MRARRIPFPPRTLIIQLLVSRGRGRAAWCRSFCVCWVVSNTSSRYRCVAIMRTCDQMEARTGGGGARGPAWNHRPGRGRECAARHPEQEIFPLLSVSSWFLAVSSGRSPPPPTVPYIYITRPRPTRSPDWVPGTNRSPTVTIRPTPVFNSQFYPTRAQGRERLQQRPDYPPR